MCFSLPDSHPGYFGKVGMRHFHLKNNPYHCPTVNVDRLWHLMSAAEQERTKKEAGKLAPVIDCNAKVRYSCVRLPSGWRRCVVVNAGFTMQQ